MSTNQLVRNFWEAGACGTCPAIVGELPRHTPAWFRKVEQRRYEEEPCIHAIAQFPQHHGKKLLEVGVGAGADHLQWARCGCDCYGVDLTDEAIDTTRQHLALYGFQSNLQRVDAETLPFEDGSFDVVYSWGVIHHSEHPERILAEIHRILRPGGKFIGMLYRRYSMATFQVWVRRALLVGRPWRSFKDVIATHIESPGTKAYTHRELKQLFGAYRQLKAKPLITPYDRRWMPAWIGALLPDVAGWFFGIEATK